MPPPRINFSSVSSEDGLPQPLVLLPSSSFSRFTWSVFSPPNSLRQRKVGELGHADRPARLGHRLALRHQHIDLRSFATISSGLWLLWGISSSSTGSKALLQGGPPSGGGRPLQQKPIIGIPCRGTAALIISPPTIAKSIQHSGGTSVSFGRSPESMRGPDVNVY